MKKTDLTTTLFDLEVFSRSKHRLLRKLEKLLQSGKGTTYIFTPNPEQLVMSENDSKFKRILQQSDLLLPDGIGLVWASRLLAFLGKNRQIEERIAGVELVQDLLDVAQKKELRVLIVGGRNYHGIEYGNWKVKAFGDSKTVDAKSFSAKDNKTIYWLEGYQNVDQFSEGEERKVGEVLTKLKPEIVFVALGAPYQEEWVVKHKKLIEKSGVKLVMVVGGAFDLILGKIARAPQILRVLGLEWLYRLAQEPWRWKRQLSLARFTGLVIKLVIKEMFVPRRPG